MFTKVLKSGLGNNNKTMPDKFSNNTSANNKRIAKNTLILYIRMFITMCIGLYTSRLVLRNLGVVDYGINDVVAGMVTMFTFISATLATGTQRFITFSLGENDLEKSKRTFSTTLFIHICLAIVLSIIILIAGLLLLNYSLNIPSDRFDAAYWVFYCSIFVIFLGVIQLPYYSLIVAHEKMDTIAFLTIYDAIGKFLVAFSLSYSGDIDTLKLFAVLSLCVQASKFLLYRFVCKKKFEECQISKSIDKSLFKSIFVFSGWNIIGCAASLLNNQGLNILLNMFFGPVVNAARGIANQVNNMVLQFVQNFLTASNPQIVKYYAVNEKDNMCNLITNSSKYAGFLILIMILPLCFEMEFVLKIWLGETPDDTIIFARIVLVQTLIQSLTRPMIMGVHAVGKLKWFSISTGSILLLIVPASWVLLKLGINLNVVLCINIIPWLIEAFITANILNRYIGFNVLSFYKKVYGIIIPIGIVSALPLTYIYCIVDEGFVRFILVGFTSCLVTGALIYKYGIDNNIKQIVLSKIITFKKRFE